MAEIVNGKGKEVGSEVPGVEFREVFRLAQELSERARVLQAKDAARLAPEPVMPGRAEAEVDAERGGCEELKIPGEKEYGDEYKRLIPDKGNRPKLADLIKRVGIDLGEKKDLASELEEGYEGVLSLIEGQPRDAILEGEKRDGFVGKIRPILDKARELDELLRAEVPESLDEGGGQHYGRVEYERINNYLEADRSNIESALSGGEIEVSDEQYVKLLIDDLKDRMVAISVLRQKAAIQEESALAPEPVITPEPEHPAETVRLDEELSRMFRERSDEYIWSERGVDILLADMVDELGVEFDDELKQFTSSLDTRGKDLSRFKRKDNEEYAQMDDQERESIKTGIRSQLSGIKKLDGELSKLIPERDTSEEGVLSIEKAYLEFKEKIDKNGKLVEQLFNDGDYIGAFVQLHNCEYYFRLRLVAHSVMKDGVESAKKPATPAPEPDLTETLEAEVVSAKEEGEDKLIPEMDGDPVLCEVFEFGGWQQRVHWRREDVVHTGDILNGKLVEFENMVNVHPSKRNAEENLQSWRNFYSRRAIETSEKYKVGFNLQVVDGKVEFVPKEDEGGKAQEESTSRLEQKVAPPTPAPEPTPEAPAPTETLEAGVAQEVVGSGEVKIREPEGGLEVSYKNSGGEVVQGRIVQYIVYQSKPGRTFDYFTIIWIDDENNKHSGKISQGELVDELTAKHYDNKEGAIGELDKQIKLIEENEGDFYVFRDCDFAWELELGDDGKLIPVRPDNKTPAPEAAMTDKVEVEAAAPETNRKPASLPEQVGKAVCVRIKRASESGGDCDEVYWRDKSNQLRGGRIRNGELHEHTYITAKHSSPEEAEDKLGEKRRTYEELAERTPSDYQINYELVEDENGGYLFVEKKEYAEEEGVADDNLPVWLR